MNNAKSPNSEFVGKRLENMRWKRGMTKKGLAEIADIDQHLISAFESGGKAPNREQAHRLAEALHAKESYFYLEWQSDLTQEDLSFRAPTKTTVRNKNAAIAIAAQGVELRSWIEKHYSLPKEDLPDYSFCVNGGDGPEAAAEFLRAHWNLGNQPIGNMIQLLELHGIAVFSAREENADLRFDAFSFFTDGQPYVFLSTSKTPERDRFDAAHELGHLVMHNSPVHKETKTRESEANLFASAFLMPAADVKAVCPFNASINAVKNLKIRWGVAATALCTRLFQLDMSTDWVRYSVMKGLAKEGYRSGEPGSGMHHEKSKICSQALRDLMKRHEMSNLLSDLCQEPNDIASLTFNCLPIVKSSPQFGVKSVGLLDSRQRAHDLGLHVVDGGLEIDV